jgi:hypothetical protein
MAEPVFYDPRRARWKRLRWLLDVTAVLVSALLVFFVYTALRDEPLPELFFFPQKRPLKALKRRPRIVPSRPLRARTEKRSWPPHR